ncbi:MAG: 3-dehydroquinate synthase [Nocardioidaceae bacterium]
MNDLVRRVPVDTADAYDVVIGTDLIDSTVALVGPAARRVAVIHPQALSRPSELLRAELVRRGVEAHAVEVPNAEDAKRPEVAAFCWSVLGRSGFTRSDVVIGLGGGATTDLAGFVAATWLRGVRYICVPTTLLGMVDAAVGGKTGVNTAEGKNLVGAFHEPAGVVCDLSVLDTLPRNELVSGMAEVVKCGFIADPRLLDLIEADPKAALDLHGDVLPTLIERSVRVKARVVAADLRETAASGGIGREALNYGHTFGHAVEQVERYHFRHGAAVAIGLRFVAELARLAGVLEPSVAERHRELLESLGLPTTYRPGLWPELFNAMHVDKKARGDQLRFVVLEDLARPVILTAPDPALLTAAYAEISR